MTDNFQKNSNIIKKLYYIILILSIFIIFLFSFSGLIFNNTLHNSGNWVNSKNKIVKAVIGAASYMNTMPALYKFTLRLSKWAGYHKLYFTKEIEPDEIEFKFRVDKNQYFSFLFNSDKEGIKSSGIRISNDSFYPPIYFHLENDRFVDKIAIPDLKIDDKTHTFKIKFLEETIQVSIDSNPPIILKEKNMDKMYIGYKAGGHDLRSDIYNLTIKSKDKSIIKESFINWKLLMEMVFYSSLLILIYLTISYLFLIKKYDSVKSLKIIAVINFFIFIVGLFISYSMYEYISKLHFPFSIVYKGYPIIPEGKDVINDYLNKYSNNKKENEIRIFFSGSSQTWGAGVYKEEDTFVSRIESLLRTKNKNLTCMNGGVSSFTSSKTLQLYKDHFDKLKPDITIINLSHNDMLPDIPNSPEIFVNNLKEYFRFNNEKNVTTIFIVEPVEIEYTVPEPTQIAMRKLAKEIGIPIIDMQTELAKHYDDGFLWWDRVHLTSFGNELFANIMYEPLLKIIQDKIK